eukprot:747065-Hanusia_phi.AAC.1
MLGCKIVSSIDIDRKVFSLLSCSSRWSGNTPCPCPCLTCYFLLSLLSHSLLAITPIFLPGSPCFPVSSLAPLPSFRFSPVSPPKASHGEKHPAEGHSCHRQPDASKDQSSVHGMSACTVTFHCAETREGAGGRGGSGRRRSRS